MAIGWRGGVLAMALAVAAGCGDGVSLSEGAQQIDPSDGGGGGSGALGSPSARNTEHCDGDRGGTCAHAIRLPSGQTLHAQTPQSGEGASTCLVSDAPQRFFALTIPVDHRAEITVSPTDWRAAVRVLNGCDATRCEIAGTSERDGAPVRVAVDNSEGRALHEIISVSGLAADAGGAFDIVARLERLSTEEPEQACVDATPLPPGGLANQFVEAGGAPFDVCPAFGAPANYYSLVVPPRTRGVVVAAGEQETDLAPLLRMLASCTTDACLDRDRMTYPDGSFVFTGYSAVGFDNFSDAPATVFVSLANPEPTELPTESYFIRPRLLALPVDPPANAQCSGAAPLPVGLGFIAVDTTATDGPAVPCPGGIPENGRVYYYSVTVPAGATLGVDLNGRFALARLREACGATACLDEAATTEDSTFDTATYTNATGAAKELIVEVGARNAVPITFSFRARLIQ